MVAARKVAHSEHLPAVQQSDYARAWQRTAASDVHQRIQGDSARLETWTHEELAKALYRTVLLREPDPPGLADAVRALRGSMTLEDALVSYFTCKEFAEKHRQFIDTYVDIRTPGAT